MPLGSLARHPPPLVEDLGRRLGEMDRGLESFDHPALHREFHWDLGRGLDVVHRHAADIADEALRAFIVALAGGIARRIEPALPRLRRQAIHGDANDYNVIVEGTRVAGFIDFGDMVFGVAVGDLAIAIAYAVLDKRQPLAAARTIVRGYHATRPLVEGEFDVLWDLVLLRLAMSVSLAGHQRAQRPDDDYLAISQEPIARTLPRLLSVPPRLAAASFRHACGLDAAPASTRAVAWLARQTPSPLMDTDLSKAMVLDLSVGSPLILLDPAEAPSRPFRPA